MPESTSRWWYAGGNTYLVWHRHPFIVHVRLGRAVLIARRWQMRLHW